MIRKMLTSDIDLIVKSELELFGHTLGYDMIYNEINHHDFAHYFVIETEEVIGYAGLWINDDIGQIVDLLIRQPYQQKGYGKELLTYVMDFFRTNNVHIVSLEVRETNQSAINLYESFGFIKSYKRVRYYDNKIDAHVMIWRDNDADISSRK